MRREFSAGVVLVRRMRGRWWFAAVRPQGKREGVVGAAERTRRRGGDARRRRQCARASRRPGSRSRLAAKLGDVRYVYTWEGERVFKVVSFFLAHALTRTDRRPARRAWSVEVAEARWLPLAEGPTLLAYKGEREMAATALEMLANDPL